jgi:Spy/CpxP family protein refolding chaperone
MPTLVKSSLLILALSLGTSAFAQEPTPAPATQQSPAAAPVRQPNPNRQAKELSKKLGLTADQTAQIEPILADRDQRVQALNSNTSLDPKSMRKQRRAIMTDSEAKLNAILTPAQQQQWATLKAERKHGAEAPAPTAPVAF